MESDWAAGDGNGSAESTGETSEVPSTVDDLTQRLAEATAMVEALKVDVTTLKQTNDDIDKKLDAYEKALPQLRQQLKDATAYGEHQRPVIECAIGDAKTKVDAAWDEVRDRIKAAEDRVRPAWEALVKAKLAVGEKERARDAAKQKLEAASKRQAYVAAALQLTVTLKGEIDTALANGENESAYVRLLELERARSLAKDNLKDLDSYRLELEGARDELVKAQNELRDATVALSHAQGAYDSAKAAVEQLKKNRVAEVLKLVKASPAPKT